MIRTRVIKSGKIEVFSNQKVRRSKKFSLNNTCWKFCARFSQTCKLPASVAFQYRAQLNFKENFVYSFLKLDEMGSQSSQTLMSWLCKSFNPSKKSSLQHKTLGHRTDSIFRLLRKFRKKHSPSDYYLPFEDFHNNYKTRCVKLVRKFHASFCPVSWQTESEISRENRLKNAETFALNWNATI